MKTFILLSTAILISPFSWSQTIKESHQEKYDEIGTFGLNHDDWALVKKDNRLGFIDNKGDEVVPTIYDEIELFSMYHKDWALVKKDNRLGFIDIKGNEVVPLKFKQLEDLKKWLDDEINKP
tara:strand:- start:337 stop:702 length:366 start_codon:yes stop_codon:yes gene_type:complete